MVGMPKRRKLAADIDADGGQDVILERVRNGETLASIARTYDVGRSMIWRYFNKTEPRKLLFEQAKIEGASSSVDIAQDNLSDALHHAKTNPQGNSAFVQAARNDADFRRWSAGVTDRRSFAPLEKTTQLNVNIEHLHLAALQASGSPLSIDVTPSEEILAQKEAEVLDALQEDDERLRLTDGPTRAEPDS